MDLVVELWTPKPAFLAASPEVRKRIAAGVRAGVAEMAAGGIRSLGWGRIGATAEHPSGHDWFAVWETPSAEAARAFFDGVAASGWYEWFDQVNASGTALSVDDALDAHVALPRESAR